MMRAAVREDIPALMDIYNFEVLNGVATFDTDEKTYEERLAWFNLHVGKYRLIVFEEDKVIKGYASLSPYHPRRAFDCTAEISVYVGKDFRNSGVGKALMKEILSLAERDGEFISIISQIESSNAVSERLHKELGFKYAGTLKDAGFKFGKRLSLDIYQYFIGEN